MKVAVIAYPLRVAGGLSVGRNVISSLSRVGDQHEYLLLMPAGLGYEETPKPQRSTSRYYSRSFGAAGQMIYENFRVPSLVRAFQPDLVWGLANFGLRRPPAPQAILFHKAHWIYPSSCRGNESRRNWLANAVGKVRLKSSLSATQLVFCQTQTALSRFRQALAYAGRMAVMPNAVSAFARHTQDSGAPRVFQELKGKSVLFCLAKYYTHKNLELFLELFRRHRRSLEDVAVLLTIQPEQGQGARKLIHAIRREGLQDHLVNVGPLEQSQIAIFYQHSRALVLPTLLESFTATYLEAMQFNCPVLTSDLDFAREVCGPAAMYFDPFDSASAAAAIRELLDTPGRREYLVQKGQERAATYFRDWDSIVGDALGELERLVREADGERRGHSLEGAK